MEHFIGFILTYVWVKSFLEFNLDCNISGSGIQKKKTTTKQQQLEFTMNSSCKISVC